MAYLLGIQNEIQAVCSRPGVFFSILCMRLLIGMLNYHDLQKDNGGIEPKQLKNILFHAFA